MAERVQDRLAELGLELPRRAASVGSYAGYKISGNQFWCVQGPVDGDELAYQGRVGRDFSMAEAQDCARLVCLNVLAQLDHACGGAARRVVQAIRLGGFIDATEDFSDHSLVMNAASDLVIHVFGERGAHARFVTGCASMPFDLALEIEAVFEIRP